MTDSTDTADATDTADTAGTAVTADTPAIAQGRPCWLELYTPDTEAAAAFYSGLLGWRVAPADPDAGISTTVTHRDHLIASFEPQEDYAGWLVTLLVDDVAAAVAEVEAAGGGVVVPCTEVPGDEVDETGAATAFAVVTDPGGARVGMISTEPGPVPPMGPGMPVWHEVLTDGLDAGIDFYKRVFGWRTRVVPYGGEDLPYRVNYSGTESLCGFGERGAFASEDATPAWRVYYGTYASEGATPAWRVYFGVENLDDAAARVPALGGRVLSGPQDIPFGKMIQVTDPDGARFMLLEVAAPSR